MLDSIASRKTTAVLLVNSPKRKMSCLSRRQLTHNKGLASYCTQKCQLTCVNLPTIENKFNLVSRYTNFLVCKLLCEVRCLSLPWFSVLLRTLAAFRCLGSESGGVESFLVASDRGATTA